MSLLIQFAAGMIFAAGLILSGMTNSDKVLNFLDLGAFPQGGWDPSLVLVMAGAAGVSLIGFRLVLRQPHPFFSSRFHLPTLIAVDRRLLLGSAIFGTGWGLAGLCPGPGIVLLGSGARGALEFCLAMLVGMFAARLWISRRNPSHPRATPTATMIQPEGAP